MIKANIESMKLEAICERKQVSSKLALIAACSLLTVFNQSALAQQIDELSLRTASHLKILAVGYANRSPRPMMIDVLRDVYYRADVDGSGEITVDDALIKQRLEHLKRRKSTYSYWAAHDVNGDALVTIEEVRQVYLPEARGALLGIGVAALSVDEAEIQARLDAQVTNRLEGLYDLDGDGTFTFEELVSGAEEEYPASRGGIARMVDERGKRWRSPILVTPMFDQDDDGEVTEAEFLAPYEALLKTYDLDQDGSLSSREVEPLAAQTNENFDKWQSIERSLWLD